MQKIKKALLLLSVFALALIPTASSYAAVNINDANKENHEVACQKNGGTIESNGSCSKSGANIADIVSGVVNILLFLVGAVAVIMLVIGGFRYVTSNGDQNSVAGAKNTIMYALIGVVVAFLAYAAVAFVTGQLENADKTSKSAPIQQTSILV